MEYRIYSFGRSRLELAQGIKDSLDKAGFETVDSILKDTLWDISSKLGIEPYVAQIIKEAAKRATELK